MKLVMLGGAQSRSSQQLVTDLKKQAADLGIETSVEFVVNADFKTLLHHLKVAGIGIHTMWNEHFGISVVEMMVGANSSSLALLCLVLSCLVLRC